MGGAVRDTHERRPWCGLPSPNIAGLRWEEPVWNVAFVVFGFFSAGPLRLLVVLSAVDTRRPSPFILPVRVKLVVGPSARALAVRVDPL